MSSIIIGKSGKQNVSLDLGILLSTRMLLTADSGGGKTFALKRIIEQAFGKIQIIAIDPEGEFSPLREKYPFVLVGKGGETPADVRSARLVAQTLLRLRANAICDLYEMKPSARHEWVRDFCDGLLEAPKEHRHPCLVIIDEVHLFAPEHGKGQSVASDSVIGLCSRGRKRLLAPLFATQRLAMLSKDASSMLLNRMVGGTFEDVNRKRAAEVLGISKERHVMQEFDNEIKTLEPGYFFALGRAISKERVLVHVGPIATAHGQDALKYEITPPPPPEAIAKMLPKLADLPKQAEEKARTESDLRNEIRTLKSQLRSQPVAKTEIRVPDQKAIDRAVKPYMDFVNVLTKKFHFLAKQFSIISNIASEYADESTKVPVFKPVQRGLPVAPAPHTSQDARSTRAVRPIIPLDGLSKPQAKILAAIARIAKTTGEEAPTRGMVAGWAGYSMQSGGFNNLLSQLNTSGLIRYPSSGSLALTREGMEKAGDQDAATPEEVRTTASGVCSGPEWKIMAALIENGEDAMTREGIAEATGYSTQSGGFNNLLSSLKTKGFIEYPDRGYVKPASWLFF